MATTYSIIKGHDGYITVNSEMGVGTTFDIYLPASQKVIPIKREAVVSPLRGKGKILVMGDKEIIRDVVSRQLRSIGHEAELARDGAEAIELYKRARESGQPFEAVILDLTVPGGMGGQETIRKLLEIEPRVKAIVSSGYSNDPVMADYKQYGFSGVIPKPYRLQDLGEILHQVMTGESDEPAKTEMSRTNWEM